MLRTFLISKTRCRRTMRTWRESLNTSPNSRMPRSSPLKRGTQSRTLLFPYSRPTSCCIPTASNGQMKSVNNCPSPTGPGPDGSQYTARPIWRKRSIRPPKADKTKLGHMVPSIRKAHKREGYSNCRPKRSMGISALWPMRTQQKKTSWLRW